MRLRNIEVAWRTVTQNAGQFSTSVFVDWWDFADWLKEREVTGAEDIVIRRWKYVERRV